MSRWRLESTLYHHLLLPLRLWCFHTPQPATGQRGSAPGIRATNGNNLSLSLCESDSTSNGCVQLLSLSSPILPSLQVAAQQNTYIDVWWSGMRT